MYSPLTFEKGDKMAKYTIKKILGMIPMLLIITFIIYWLLDLTPGDPVSYLMDPEALARLTAEQVAALRAQYGLDDPFFVRYFKWLGRLLTGDFGYSSSSGVPVIQIMAERLPATLELAVAALCISTVLGSVLGVLGAIYKGTIGDNVLTVAGMIGVSIPQFFFGVCAILIFALNLGWLPVGGRTDPTVVNFAGRIKYLVMPALVLGISMTAGVMRYARSSMLDTMNHGGRIAMLGIPPSDMSIDWTKVIFKGLFIKGIYGREMFETWYKMAALIQSGLDLSPIITHRFGIDDFQKGFDAMRSGQSGKVVLSWD